jgi:hypothetical protein
MPMPQDYQSLLQAGVQAVWLDKVNRQNRLVERLAVKTQNGTVGGDDAATAAIDQALGAEDMGVSLGNTYNVYGAEPPKVAPLSPVPPAPAAPAPTLPPIVAPASPAAPSLASRIAPYVVPATMALTGAGLGGGLLPNGRRLQPPRHDQPRRHAPAPELPIQCINS